MKDKLTLIFRIISIIVVIILLYYIANWYINNKHNQSLLNNLFNEFYINSSDENSVSDNSEASVSEKPYDNFNKLLSQNLDCIAWLKVNNTNIDYPVVHTTNNTYYLTHSFDKSNNGAGWIFADYRCNSDFSSANTIIYGHNIKNGSMFASLKNVITPEWYENNYNYIITVYLPNKTMKYQVFSVYQTNYRDYNTAVDFSSDLLFQNYIDEITKKSTYNFNIAVTSKDKVLTLSTCANNNEYRIVLHAKKI